MGCSQRNLISALTSYINTWLSQQPSVAPVLRHCPGTVGLQDSTKGFGSEVKVMSQVTCTLGRWAAKHPWKHGLSRSFGTLFSASCPHLSLFHTHTHTHTHTATPREKPDSKASWTPFEAFLCILSIAYIFPVRTIISGPVAQHTHWACQDLLMTQEPLTVQVIEGWCYSSI